VSIFLDTSVLVPVFLADHPHHASSLNLFARCEPETANCAAHSLAEVYATLTRLPLPHRAAPEQAIQCVQKIHRQLRLISLDGAEYLAAIQNAAAQSVAGGTTYDSLIASCALRSGADEIYSWNVRHFRQFGPEVARRLTTPERE
jgi:predicted nucleic acid-binding protein